MKESPDKSGEDRPAVDRDSPSLCVWFTAPRKIELRPCPLDKPHAGEVRVRALYSGISHGTELLVYRGEVPPGIALDIKLSTLEGSADFPLKYGYASVGRVVEAGAGVETPSEGDMVFAFNPHQTEYVIPACHTIKLPEGASARRAIFLANIETAINAMLDAAPRIGERVVIFGQGVVGLLIAQLARRCGAGAVITVDPIERRRALSLALGADSALDPSDGDVAAAIRKLTSGAGADIAIEASGRPDTLDQALKSVAFEGRVVVVSWYGVKRSPVALGNEFHRNRLTVKSSQVSNLDPRLSPRWTVERRRGLALDYLGELRLDELITHTFAFEEAEAAYRLIDEQQEESVQVILDYGGIEG
jgi:2-desacetyl-2-hydroxyethyl bacteriochlorophyllide A dehydrogenase